MCIASTEEGWQERFLKEKGPLGLKNLKPTSVVAWRSLMFWYFNKKELSLHDDCWSKGGKCRISVGGFTVLRFGSLGSSRAPRGGLVLQVRSSTCCLPRLELQSEINKYFTYIDTWSSQQLSEAENIISILPVRTDKWNAQNNTDSGRAKACTQGF